MDVANERWGDVAVVDEAAGKGEGLLPWPRLRGEKSGCRHGRGRVEGGVISTLNVVAGHWGGVAAVDVAAQTTDGLLP